MRDVLVDATLASVVAGPAKADLIAFAPAKLNLGLRIFPRRTDGFHDIESWFVPISLRDTLSFRKADALTLELSGLAAELSAAPETNLVGRAALALAKVAGMPPGAHIHLHKLIPTGGGLGGGSSDAATTLLALRQLWKLPMSDQDLRRIAAQLGSDVPFFVHGHSAVCRGRGEIIEALPLNRLLYAVLVMPPYGTSTKEVYEMFDRQAVQADTTVINWMEISQMNAAGIRAGIRNDLEGPAFAVTPKLRGLRDQVGAIIHRPVHLSGSGSTLFILADQAAEAESMVQLLEQQLEPTVRVLPVRLQNESGDGFIPGGCEIHVQR